MQLTPAAIEAYKQLVIDPASYGFFDYKPLKEYFQESDQVTPKDTLYNSYIAVLRRPLPKFVFYIIMNELFGHLIGKDEQTGYLGYKLVFNA